jgi:hypothetical protein
LKGRKTDFATLHLKIKMELSWVGQMTSTLWTSLDILIQHEQPAQGPV